MDEKILDVCLLYIKTKQLISLGYLNLKIWKADSSNDGLFHLQSGCWHSRYSSMLQWHHPWYLPLFHSVLWSFVSSKILVCTVKYIPIDNKSQGYLLIYWHSGTTNKGNNTIRKDLKCDSSMFILLDNNILFLLPR